MSVGEVNNNNSGFINFFEYLGAAIRRHPIKAKIERNLPIFTQAWDVATRISQPPFSTIFQAFNTPDNQSPSPSPFKDPKVVSFMGNLRFVSGIVGLIAAIAKIVEESIEIHNEKKKGRSREKTEAVMRLLEGIASLGDSISSFSRSLYMLGWADPAKIISWAPGLSIASSILSLVTIKIHMDEMEHSETHLHNLKPDDPDLALKWLGDELQDSRRDGAFFLQRYFEIPNREKYGAQVLHIIREGLDEDKEELVSALKGRVTDKITSHHLAIVAAFVSLVAGIILLLAVGTPWIALGIAFFASLLTFIKYVKDKRSIGRLEDVIDRIKPFEEIPVEWLQKEAKFALPCLSDEIRKSLKAPTIALPQHDPKMFISNPVALPLVPLVRRN